MMFVILLSSFQEEISSIRYFLFIADRCCLFCGWRVGWREHDKNRHFRNLEIQFTSFVILQDETHYFVMTAKKQSLLQRGVLIKNEPDTAKLLANSNINQVQFYSLFNLFNSNDQSNLINNVRRRSSTMRGTPPTSPPTTRCRTSTSPSTTTASPTSPCSTSHPCSRSAKVKAL